ncbi:MAG: AMIN domain-containing protein [Cyanobacteriota bacterium]|nr:AMIN domain-containing protein [Cyanobacteriota bacterium]
MTNFKFSLLFISGLSAVLFALPVQAARLLFWRFDPGQNQLIFSTDSGVQPTAQLISNPTRLVIDLPGIALGRPTVNQAVGGSAAIRNLRVGQFDDRTTRIVVELAPGYTLDPNKIVFRGVSPTNWSVRLPNPERLAADRIPEPTLTNAVATRPVSETRVNDPALEGLATIEAIEWRDRRLVVRANQPVTASADWNDGAGYHIITIPNARLAERIAGPQLPDNSPFSQLRVRQQDSQTVILLLPGTPELRGVRVNPRGRRLDINFDRTRSLAIPAEPAPTAARHLLE